MKRLLLLAWTTAGIAHADLKARGVAFEAEPRKEGYGTVAVFRDLYGNRWDLLQLEKARP
jgi:hypothetical protein